jgi:hypothetical protein
MANRVAEIMQRVAIQQEKRKARVLSIALEMAVKQLHKCGWHDGGVQHFKSQAEIHYFDALKDRP